jgi:hypothetical protein
MKKLHVLKIKEHPQLQKKKPHKKTANVSNKDSAASCNSLFSRSVNKNKIYIKNN